MQKTPDAAMWHMPTAEYVQSLIRRIGRPYREVAAALGCGERTVERWAATGAIPYTAQFALEAMASAADAQRRRVRSAHPLDGIEISSKC